jgi:hypothetical protein
MVLCSAIIQLSKAEKRSEVDAPPMKALSISTKKFVESFKVHETMRLPQHTKHSIRLPYRSARRPSSGPDTSELTSAQM